MPHSSGNLFPKLFWYTGLIRTSDSLQPYNFANNYQKRLITGSLFAVLFSKAKK